MISVINLFIILFVLGTVLCHPKSVPQWLRRDETRLPNGTVVGKYMYFDKEGAAVNVKYYADDDGYGVELKSLKVSNLKQEKSLGPHKEVPAAHREITAEPKEYNPIDTNFLNENTEKETQPNLFEVTTGTSSESNINLVKDILEKRLHKNKLDYQNQYETTPEYDIFVEKKTPGAQNRNKKAKVYLNKNERDRRALAHSIKKFGVRDIN